MLCALLTFITSVTAGAQETPAATDPLTKAAVEAYVYMYPLVVFGVSYEVLTNVEKPTWESLSAPLNQFIERSGKQA